MQRLWMIILQRLRASGTRSDPFQRQAGGKLAASCRSRFRNESFSDNKFQLLREDSYNRDQGSFGSYTKRNAVQRTPQTGVQRHAGGKLRSLVRGGRRIDFSVGCSRFSDVPKNDNTNVSPAFSKAVGCMGQSPCSLSAESETLRVVRRAQPSDISMIQPDSGWNQAIIFPTERADETQPSEI